ncbi:MAG: hypothetical protein BAA01_09535 [Bacillus thermozeamaize]|uniref:Uncharacterized protein n=1 Tax=Bacillus thermozeamaize TaxID=230954 RepID=A0A1Y3PEF4_9BACI|nr:MAG: hypothetical protein BAA01_09535 [Bacillus thermozeamaize]
MSETIWLDGEHKYALHIYNQNGQFYGSAKEVPRPIFDDSRLVDIKLVNGKTIFNVGPEDSRKKVIEIAKEELKRFLG